MTSGTADILMCIPPSTVVFMYVVIQSNFRTKLRKNKDLSWWERAVENSNCYLFSPSDSPEHI